MYKKNLLNRNLGFTLVEVLVSLAIFMLVMVIGISSLFTSSKSTRGTQALRFAMDNVNYAMDHMSRSLRLGSEYYCSNTKISFSDVGGGLDCVNGIDLYFKPSEHSIQDTNYRLSDNGTVQKRFFDGTNTDFIDLTAPEVTVTELRFVVTGSEIFDVVQPRVLILMKGHVDVDGQIHEFALQTLASQRNAE